MNFNLIVVVTARSRVLLLEEEVARAAAPWGDRRGLIKLVVEEGTDRLLGVHLLAASASEIIHEAMFALKAGSTLEEVALLPHVSPSLSEALFRAAETDLQKRG